jgi:hypothetical protein
MIKKFCDRCGKEITGEPWHMKWSQNSSCGLSSESVYQGLCSRADAANTYSNAIFLNADPMYCDECRAEIIAFASQSDAEEFIIGTEVGVCYQLETDNPTKRFYFPKTQPCCRDMKLNTPENILRVLETGDGEVKVDEETRERALIPLDRMLELGGA